MSEKTKDKPLSARDKQTQPLSNEIDPKAARVKVLMAAQKTKTKFKLN